MRKIVSSVMLALILISMLTIAFNIKPVKAEWTETVYIRADGTIYPPDAPIITYDNITYTLTDNITSSGDGIIVERDNIVVDGAGNTIRGVGFEWGGIGILLIERSNVTIKNVHIQEIFVGIDLYKSSNNSLIGNSLTDTGNGIFLHGTYEKSSKHNTIFGNTIARSQAEGIRLESSSNNMIHHNNFLDNHLHVYCFVSTNAWDDGYPSGGNYWSDYTDTDLYSGHYQNETGGDGIGDSPYVIGEDNVDNYPLVGPFRSFNTSLGISSDIVSNSTIGDFQYFATNRTIVMHVSNTTADQTHGFCRLTIPHTLIAPPYNITVNNNPIGYNTIFENETISIIYFTYEHSTLEIIIIPEFPSNILLLTFMMLATIPLIFAKKKTLQKSEHIDPGLPFLYCLLNE